MSRVAVLLVALLVLAVSGPAFSQAFDDSAIRPGEAIGPFRLGATYDQVTGVFGRRAGGEGTRGDPKGARGDTGGGGATVKPIAVFNPAAAMPGPAPAITPGVGIGAARLGMSTDEVIRAMGQAPGRRGRAADGRELLIFVLPEKDMFGDNAWVTVYVDRAGAYLITTDSVNHFTAQGNNPGSGILELQAEFGGAFRREELLTPWPRPPQHPPNPRDLLRAPAKTPPAQALRRPAVGGQRLGDQPAALRAV